MNADFDLMVTHMEDNVLSELAHMCVITAYVYCTVHRQVKDPYLRQVCSDYAQQRGDFLEQLQPFIDADEMKNIEVDLLRLQRQITLKETSLNLIQICMDWEKRAQTTYMSVDEQSLPLTAQNLVHEQLAEIKSAHEYMSVLYDVWIL